MEKLKKNLSKIILILSLSIILSLLIITISKAVSVSYTEITNVEAATINLINIDWNNPTSIEVSDTLGVSQTDDFWLIYFKQQYVEAGSSIEGSYTITYENVGIDSNGEYIDLVIECNATDTNLLDDTTLSLIESGNEDYYFGLARIIAEEVVTNENGTEGNVGCFQISSSSFNLENSSYTNTSANANIRNYLYLNCDFALSFYKTGTENLAEGNYLFYMSDLDVVKAWDKEYKYTERITLGDGFENIVYLDENTTVGVDGTTFYGTLSDNATEISSLTTLANSSFKFTWNGIQAGTYLGLDFETHEIESNIYTSQDGGETYSLDTSGGSVTANNITSTSYSVLEQTDEATQTIGTYWKNDYEYSYTVNSGYVLSKIEVDGEEISVDDTYEFTEVTEDHIINYYYILSITSDYTVNYLDYYSNEQINDSKEVENIAINTVLDTSTEIIDIDGYTYNSIDLDTLTIVYDSTQNVINIYYIKNVTITVKYVDYTTGLSLTNDVVIETYQGKEYETEQKEIDTYTFYYVDGETSGTVGSENLTIIYYYIQEVDLSFTKVNSSGTTTLSGTTFNLYRKLCSDDHSSDLIGTGDYDTDCWELVGTYTSDSDGVIFIEGVNITYTYRLVETKASLGYVLPEGEWELTFNDETAESLVEVIDGITLSVQGVNNPLAMSYIDSTIYIYNEAYFDIPTTGSFGIQDYIFIGIDILGIGLIIVLIYKIKR